MRIAVVGATGNVGSRLVRLAASAGHQVVAYARHPEAVPATGGVTVVGGQVEDVDAFAAAIRGADVLVSLVGGGFKDTTLLRRTVPYLLEAVSRAGVPRLVMLSVFGAGDTADKAALLPRLVYRLALREFLADRVEAERLVAASGCDHTMVFPVNLKDAPGSGHAGVVALDKVVRVPGMPTLPMDDAAAAILQIATEPAPSGSRILVTTPAGWR